MGQDYLEKVYPPSKSFVFRCFLHDRCPTDEQGNIFWFLSTCLCSHGYEGSPHILLECHAKRLWTGTGISSLICGNLSTSSTQLRDITLAAIIFTINIIWYARNQCMFK